MACVPRRRGARTSSAVRATSARSPSWPAPGPGAPRASWAPGPAASTGRQVDRRAFTPPPDVESSALVLDFLPGPRAQVRDERRFRALVKAAFMHRRKTLWNAVKGMAGAREALERAGIDPKRRGETLS